MTQLSHEQARELGGLGLSQVDPRNAMLDVRAAQWAAALTKLGMPVPFWLVHDVGLLFVWTPDSIGTRKGVAQVAWPPDVLDLLRMWRETLVEIQASEVVERSQSWRLSDALVVVVLLRILGPLYERHLGVGRPPPGVALPVDPELYEGLDGRLGELFSSYDRRADIVFLRHVVSERLRLITAIEQIDLDTLRLLGMFGAEATAASAFGPMDLLQVLESPEANDVVNFSLDLLPSVLETRRASGAQTFAADGYAGLARRGTLDSLVLSELAHEDDLFDQRFSENEVFYYAREKTREEERHCHYICVDATASMRGQRAVFARGLALTLIKKFQLRGEDVYFRFFDSRLYDVGVTRAKQRSRGGIDVPYVLAFKGEHGRNYAKVFGLLANDVARLKKRERRTVTLYLVTHAECHVPLDVIERLRSVANLYGIFMLPSSGELDLEYLPRLHRVQVVTERALSHREARAKRAIDIVEDAAGEKAAKPATTEDAQRSKDLADAEREIERMFGGPGGHS